MTSKTITITITQSYDVSFSEWYDNKEEGAFPSKADAVKQWKAMWRGCGGERVEERDCEFEDIADALEALEDDERIETPEEIEAARLKRVAEALAAQKKFEDDIREAEALKVEKKLRKIEELKKQLAELEA